MEPGRVQTLLNEAIRSAKSGNTSWARDCLGRVIRADPNNEQAWLWMSAVLETPSEKRYCLERVLVLNPQNSQAQAGLHWLEQQDQIEEEEETGPKRTICPMCGEPNDPRAFRCVNCEQDLFVQCPQCGERADIDKSTCPNCELEIGDSTDGPAFFFQLGELYLEHGHPKTALDSWDKTLLLQPDYPRVAEVAAEAFLASNQRDLAVQSFHRAIEEAEEEDHQRRLRLRLANVHRELGQMEESVQIYQELLQEDKERKDPQADVYTELGRFYQLRDDIEQARYYYDMALALDDELHEIRFAQAQFLLDEGYELRALSEFGRLSELEGELGERARSLVQKLRPAVPESFRNRWQETVRGMARYFLAGLLLLALSLGREWQHFNPQDLIALISFLLGGYFLTAAIVTPRNLPTFEHMGEMAEGPLAMRLRRMRKSAVSDRGGKPPRFQQFIAWQSQSARQLTARLQVGRARFAQWLQRTVEASIRNWQRLKQSRAVLAVKNLPQTPLFQRLAALGQKPFFQALGRAFQAVGHTIGHFFGRAFGPILRRILPHRGGTPLFQQLKEALKGSFKRMVESVGQTEVSELQLYRGLAAFFGLLSVILGCGLVLLY